jgi:hypothetical protein
VVEYMGEILDAGELKRRTEQYDNEGDQHLYFMQIDAHNTVDASRMSNLARFLQRLYWRCVNEMVSLICSQIHKHLLPKSL